MLDVEWTVTHFAQIDIDSIVELIQCHRRNFTSLDKCIRWAIGEEVACLEDEAFYSWTDDAEVPVREEVEKRLAELGIE